MVQGKYVLLLSNSKDVSPVIMLEYCCLSVMVSVGEGVREPTTTLTYLYVEHLIK